MPAVVDHVTLQRWTAGVGRNATSIQLHALTWSDDVDRVVNHGGGGFIPEEMPRAWGPPNDAQLNELLEILVTHELWDRVEGGFQIRGFDRYTTVGLHEQLLSLQRKEAGSRGGRTTQNGHRQEALPVDPGGRRSSRSEANGKQTQTAGIGGDHPSPQTPHPSEQAVRKSACSVLKKDSSVGV